jgi:hypothetical protein
MARSAHFERDGPDKSGARCRKDAVTGAPEGARVPQGTSHKDLALFGAPPPLTLRTHRVAARSPHARVEILWSAATHRG